MRRLTLTFCIVLAVFAFAVPAFGRDVSGKPVSYYRAYYAETMPNENVPAELEACIGDEPVKTQPERMAILAGIKAQGTAAINCLAAVMTLVWTDPDPACRKLAVETVVVLVGDTYDGRTYAPPFFDKRPAGTAAVNSLYARRLETVEPDAEARAAVVKAMADIKAAGHVAE